MGALGAATGRWLVLLIQRIDPLTATAKATEATANAAVPAPKPSG